MNLAVSNIAWSKEENDKALEILARHGISHLEVAPTILFADILAATDQEIKECRTKCEARGFHFVSMQSLLFGAAPYSIFDEESKVAELLTRLERVFHIGKLLGVRSVVFGSPKNRIIRDAGDVSNEAKALSFFTRAAEIGQKNDIVVCLEANPEAYGGNFITTTPEAIEWVTKINHPYLRLNLDTGAILMNGHNPAEIIASAAPYINHVQISAPLLGEITDTQIDHKAVVDALKKIGFQKFVSLEMKTSGESPLAMLERNVAVFNQNYQ